MLNLISIPVGGEVAEVNNLHICAVPFNLLRIPQRECIVIAIGEYDTVFINGVKIVHTEITGGVAS